MKNAPDNEAMTNAPAPELTAAQRRHLRGLGHTLRPVVAVGAAGLSAAVLAELETALAHHELLKVSVRAGDRDERDALVRELCDAAGATLVQRIGNVALLYRPGETGRIALPPAAPD